MLIETISTFLLTLLLIWFLKKYASHVGLIDIPNARSSHKEATSRGAGIGFILAFFLMIILFFRELFMQYPWTFMAMFIVFLIGLIDDSVDTHPYLKFIVIIIGTLFLFFDGIMIGSLGEYFGYEMTLGWFALPFTLFAVVGFTNALNLIDGLDGLAALLSIIIFSAFLWIGVEHNDDFMRIVSLLSMVMLLAFLVFNWAPASIFMGDSGSLTLGFIVSVLAIKSLAYIPTVSILFLAAVPILDTVIVMVRRKLSHRSIVSADKCHIHHIVYEVMQKKTAKTVLLLGSVQLLYTFFGLQWHKGSNEVYLLLFFILNVFFLYRLLSWAIEVKKIEC